MTAEAFSAYAYVGEREMRTENVRDFPDFIRKVENYDLLSSLIVFRGQATRGQLLPSIAREKPQIDTSELEQKLLEQLSLMGAAFLRDKNPRSLELMVLAQHFGLKTRLLDWTSNPLAALWFACSEAASGDVYVYALAADSLQVQNVYDENPFKQSKTRVFQPRLDNPRILAQHGWFTLHRYSKAAQGFVALESNKEIKDHLSEFKIPELQRPDLLRSLDRHGINRRTLFPDLEGLCKHLNWQFNLPEAPR